MKRRINLNICGGSMILYKQIMKEGSVCCATLLYEWSCQEGTLCKFLRKWNSYIYYLLNARSPCVPYMRCIWRFLSPFSLEKSLSLHSVVHYIWPFHYEEHVPFSLRGSWFVWSFFFFFSTLLMKYDVMLWWKCDLISVKFILHLASNDLLRRPDDIPYNCTESDSNSFARLQVRCFPFSDFFLWHRSIYLGPFIWIIINLSCPNIHFSWESLSLGSWRCRSHTPHISSVSSHISSWKLLH